MRRFWIHTVLPTLLVLLPVAGGVLLFLAIPADARRDYQMRLQNSPIDWLILGLGTILFLVQIRYARRAMQWQVNGFDESGDAWLSHLAQAAEWFPLLGLIGTVAAILQTFGKITPGSNPTPQDIIRSYAPAITATGSGLFMALMNILPIWVAQAGREWIRSLAGPKANDPRNDVVPLAHSADGVS
jgi:MotA/TolQ/ExbB proton channel family